MDDDDDALAREFNRLRTSSTKEARFAKFHSSSPVPYCRPMLCVRHQNLRLFCCAPAPLHVRSSRHIAFCMMCPPSTAATATTFSVLPKAPPSRESTARGSRISQSSQPWFRPHCQLQPPIGSQSGKMTKTTLPPSLPRGLQWSSRLATMKQALRWHQQPGTETTATRTRMKVMMPRNLTLPHRAARPSTTRAEQREARQPVSEVAAMTGAELAASIGRSIRSASGAHVG